MTFGLLSKHNNKYLCHIDEDPQLHGFLQFSGDKFPATCTEFNTEQAKTANEFVNIRYVYNNKYWVSRYKNDEHWIVAEADEPNEDQSNSSCTLFQVIPVDGSGAIRLLHVQLKKYVCLSKDSPQFPFRIFAGSIDPDSDGFDFDFKVSMVKNMPIQSRRFAFKGDNGKYLEVEVIDGVPYLKFSAKDIHDPKVWFECPNIAKTTIGRIKSNFNNEFWRCDLKWVHADTTSGDRNNTLFRFEWVNHHKKIVALRVGNFYCQRYVDDEGKSSKMDCLIADASEITDQAKLHVEAPKRRQ